MTLSTQKNLLKLLSFNVYQDRIGLGLDWFVGNLLRPQFQISVLGTDELR